MSFVDGNGNPFVLSPTKPAKKGSSRGPRDMGYKVVGFQRHHLDSARRAHDQENAGRKLQDMPPLPPFDESVFMKTTAAHKINPKPFVLREAAEQFRDLAAKSGWLGARVEHVTRGQ